MRYLVNIETNESIAVGDSDDAQFYALLSERTDAGRQKYEQTGAHDPRVTQIEVPGQADGTSAFGTAGLTDEGGAREDAAPHTALGEEAVKAADLKPKSATKAKSG